MSFEKVTHFKYLGSWITEDAKSGEDIRARVGMAKAAFWQNKELMRSIISFSSEMKILNCYVFIIIIIIIIVLRQLSTLKRGLDVINN